MAPAGEPTPPSPKKVMRQLRGQDAAELAAAYQAGVTLKELAVRYGIHRETVSIVLERQGVPRRRSFQLTTDDQVKAAVVAYAAGDSLRIIAERMGVDRKTVARRLRQAGVTPRKGNGLWPVDK
jgi:DNA-binding transcriptional regulator LsrR (DeoR family)